MAYYMVLAGDKRQATPLTPSHIEWGQIIGVFSADDGEAACKAAAVKRGSAGTYFAVEGYPWGLSMMDAGTASELGADDPLDPLQTRIRDLERQLHIGSGDA